MKQPGASRLRVMPISLAAPPNAAESYKPTRPGPAPGLFACAPSMFDSLEVKVLCPSGWRRRASEAQGRRREAGSEGSVEKNRGPMDKNRIRGLPGRTSRHVAAKSRAIKGRGGRSRGRAAKVVVSATISALLFYGSLMG